MKRYFIKTIFVFFVFFSIHVSALPELINVIIDKGSSRRIRPDNYCRFMYWIKNKDARGYNLKISIKSTGGEIVYYDKYLRILPKRTLKDSIYIKVPRGEKFDVILSTRRGSLIEKISVSAIQTFSSNTKSIAFLNDNFDYGYGTFKNRKLLNSRYTPMSYRAETLPPLWIDFASFAIIVIQDLDWDKVSLESLNALRDYVTKGGTIVFDTPVGVMKTYQKNYFVDMLPGIPIKIRKVTDSTFLSKWVKTTPEWNKGVDFLEIYPSKNTITSLKYKDLPAIIWKRVGLGKVGICAFSISSNEIQRTDTFAMLWNHFMSFANSKNAVSNQRNNEIHSILEMLSGITIPGASMVLKFILIYSLVTITILLLGFVFKKQKISWCILIISSSIFSYFIINKAIASSGKKSTTKLASSISILSGNTEENIVSMYTEKSLDANIQSDGYFSRLGYIPPRKAGNGFYMQRVTNGQAFRMRYKNNGYSFFSRFSIKARQPSYLTIASRKNNLLQSSPIADIIFSENSISLSNVKLPKFSKENTVAYLILENGFRYLDIKNDTITLRSNKNNTFLKLDTILAKIENTYKTLNYPSPAICFIKKSTSQIPECPDDFKYNKHQLMFFPVNIFLKKGLIQVPKESIKILTNKKMSRMLVRNNQYMDVIQRSEKKEFTLTAVLPPYFTGLKAESIDIDIAISNPGKNINVSSVIITKNNQQISGTSDKSIVHFKNVSTKNFISASDATFSFKLLTRTKQQVKNMLEVGRVNKWNVIHINISAIMKTNTDIKF